jgi:exodeoxyribonuclease VIII
MNLEQIKTMHDIGELKGLFPGVEDSVYHAPDCPGKSSSFFKTLIAETPLHAMAKLTKGEETDAMILGRGTHLAVQDPSEFGAKYTVVPEGMRRDPRAKAYQEFLAANPGKHAFTQDEWDTIKSIQTSFFNHPLSKLLVGAKIEHSGWWTDPSTGVICKCRPDWFIDGVVYDLKTSAKGIGPWAFEKTIADYGYAISAAMYLEGISEILGEKLKKFVLIAAEKSAPYEIIFYDIDHSALEKGASEFRRAIEIYAECEKTGNFPGYSKDFQSIGLPAFAY